MVNMKLQFFGGRGASSGISTENNIVAFKGRETKQENDGWDYKGEKERVDKLIQNAKQAKSVKQINRAALSLKKEDENISTLIKNAKADDGNMKALNTLRRKIRQQRKSTKL